MKKLNFLSCLMVLVLSMPACSSQASRSPRVEVISFQSGSFHIVGDLRLPGGGGPYPVILFIHGSGPADRIGSGEYLPIMEQMLQAGYATFAWDKPGTGESTGKFDPLQVHSQRAQILLDAIQLMKGRSDIDPAQIGLWGSSQAGYVIPRVLAQSEDIAFVICVSCAGMSSADQMAFQVTALRLCDVPEEKTGQKAGLLSELDQSQTYETYAEYLHYREVLKALADLGSVSIGNWPALPEEAWQKNDPEIQGWWNPIEVIEGTTIPVLAIFGDKDRQIDPLQGAYAYRQALAKAGNPYSRVEVFTSANHGIMTSETGCPEDDSRFYSQWLEQYLKSKGYGSLSEAQEALKADPYQPGLISNPPFAPGYLDLIGDWLENLRVSR